MNNILLIEPDYKNKYPPLGLMKISSFHKNMLNDYVLFTKGRLSSALANTKWDHIYISSMFTFEWRKTIETIEYSKTLVDSIDKITVGGITATLLSDEMFIETGIKPVCGLLNKPGKLGLPNDDCIDQMIPDYSMLEDTSYVYPYHDAYFLSATKGCGMKCGFCAVQTLEPTYIPYIDIKEKITAIAEKFGAKKDLLLMDNNVLRSVNFNQIIDDIIEVGFRKGATYVNPRTGKTVQRFVDFNQGLDGNLLTEEKAKRLGEIALKPARIAFDHIEDRQTYERAFHLCVKYGINELSNYVLYNSENFSGKGQNYRADTPEDLYERMRITIDLKEEVNQDLPKEQKIAAFSFPMRYIPLSAKERGYVGSKWNAKFLRAIQCMLIPTQGKGVGNRNFFEADFGRNSKEFVRFLCMPDKLIAARGNFTIGGRKNKKETPSELKERKEKWDQNQRKIKEWNRLYDKLEEETDSFNILIADNMFYPEKLLTINPDKQKQLYLLYLTVPRLISLLGMLDSNSPTYDLIYNYITQKFPCLYEEILDFVTTNESQQQYIFKNFASFFGKKGITDVIECIERNSLHADKQFEKWNVICKKMNIRYIDFELLRVHARFVEENVLSPTDYKFTKEAIHKMDMLTLASILSKNLKIFEVKLLASIEKEIGQSILKSVTKTIVSNIQVKLDYILREA